MGMLILRWIGLLLRVMQIHVGGMICVERTGIPRHDLLSHRVLLLLLLLHIPIIFSVDIRWVHVRHWLVWVWLRVSMRHAVRWK